MSFFREAFSLARQAFAREVEIRREPRRAEPSSAPRAVGVEPASVEQSATSEDAPDARQAPELSPEPVVAPMTPEPGLDACWQCDAPPVESGVLCQGCIDAARARFDAMPRTDPEKPRVRKPRAKRAS